MIPFLKKAPTISVITSVMVVYSVVLMCISIALGIDYSTRPDTFGYLQKWNWMLFPFYWLILALLIYYSWECYMTAWRALSKHNVLFQKEQPSHDGAVIAPFLNQLVIHRYCIIAVSLILGIVLTSIDADCLWNEYGILTPNPLPTCTAQDFTVAFRLGFPSVKGDMDKVIVFVIAAYIMQGILIAFAWIALFQLLIHTIFFLRFEKLGYPKATHLSLKLNPRDPFLEYGLSEVNRAIHTTYMCIVLGMIIPVISAYSQESDSPPDVGQWLLTSLLPLILILPLAITYWDRVRRGKQMASYVKAKNDPALSQMYGQQRLWISQRTKISHIGRSAVYIVLMVEYGYLFTKNFTTLF